jgi:Transposase IS66 family
MAKLPTLNRLSEQEEDALISALWAEVQRLQTRVTEDETSARVHGQQQWEWVFQNSEVCIHVIRPSRGQGVIQEVLGRIGRRSGCPISIVRNRTTPLRTGRSVWPTKSGIVSLPLTREIPCSPRG